MTIAIQISPGISNNYRESFNFICFTKIAAEQPSHHFIFIFDKQPGPELKSGSNCTIVLLLPQIRNRLLNHYWFNYKIPALLERFNADVFVTAGNTSSIRTTVPQCMIIENLSSTQKKNRAYWNKLLPVYVNNAKAICITNPVLESELLRKYGIEKNRLTIIFPGLSDKNILNGLKTNEEVKKEYTSGKEYFLYEVRENALKQLVIVLKGFSLFKKWFKSDMQLVLFMKRVWGPEISALLSSYKYKDELIIIKEPEQEANILKAAYTLVITGNDCKTGLHAMKFGIPVIAENNSTTKKIFSEAALLFELNEKNISEKMMIFYKDEHLRMEYISKGIEVTNQYSWEITTVQLWGILRSIAKQ